MTGFTRISDKRKILAGFANAHWLALRISEAANINTAVTRTDDPTQPFRVSISDPRDPKQILRVQQG